MRWKMFIVFLFLLSKGYGQKQENEYKKMIDSAISITCQKLLKPTENLGIKDLYLIDEKDLYYNYTGMFAGLGFKRMNVLDSRNVSVVKKGIHAWKIFPVLQGRILKVTIINFLITYKSRNYNFSNGGGSETVFEYSCNEGKWVLVKSEYQGL